MPSIAAVFAPAGALSDHFPGYTHRVGQERMAELIWDSFASGRHTVIEAGTGIGKTFAYLVPVLLAGRRAIVSTGTKTLQDQLMEKDLPALGAAIGRPADVAVLKGRNNYLCWHRLELARADPDVVRQSRDLVEALATWGRSHATGDLSELQDLDAEYSVRARVTSTVDNCLGAQCEQFDRCFVAAARRRAHEATIVVVNHHLLLADLALKESGFGDLLGNAASVIVDEAHLLPEIAQQFFGTAASTREVESVLRDMHAELRAAGVKESELGELSALTKSVVDVRRLTQGEPGRTPWRDIAPRQLAAFVSARDALLALAEQLASMPGLPPGLVRCRERLEDHGRRLSLVLDEEAGEQGLRWLEVGRQSAALHRTPFETGDPLSASIEAQGGVWIFASATLAVGDDFSHFIARIGIDAPVTAVLPSPFDYARQARIYVPEGLPDPGDPAYTVSLMRHVWPLIEATAGGAFILFTSHRALQEAHAWVELRAAPGPVLVQGAGPRSELLNEFRAAGNAILLGTSSFWQGVDVRGMALRLVVIDKLPFAAPNDPYIEARVKAIERRGGNPFMEFQVPQAVLTLKQGVGRLIRDDSDRGLIVIGDPRIRTRRYGSVFIASLPPAPLLDDIEDALSFAVGLRPAEVCAEAPEERCQ